MLESMLDAYDNLNIKDAWVIEKQGKCVEELVDVIIEKLNRLLNSKTRLSCRNVLVANFKTMKDTKHWVKRKLFADLPKDLSKVLRDKIDQMVDSLKALILKIIDVEADFADRFFDKLKNRYLKKKRRTSDYELWKVQQSHLTIELITGYQAEITADMLIMGILKYDKRPDGEEVAGVDLEKLRKKLEDGKPLPKDFDKECAKLRRYSHWEGDMFMIDYHHLRKYLFCAFGKLTCEQHIKMYEYDIQMKQIHEDIKRLKEEEMCAEGIQNVDVKMDEEKGADSKTKTESGIDTNARSYRNDNTLSANRQAILDQLLDLTDKGDWVNGITSKKLKTMLRIVLGFGDTLLIGKEVGLSETLWHLLESGRGDRVKIVWQNMVGYLDDRKLFRQKGSPALNKDFFGDDKGYTNIDKGRPSKGLMTPDFESIIPLLDAYCPEK